MPTSSYSPDLRVEIAFDSGFRTPAASRTWTDVSDYVELKPLLTINGGRNDERSQADANQLTLTLDNRDGRFTAGRSSSPYYPNVKLDRPIRVLSDPVDGTQTVRFLGFVSEWPLEWEGTDGYAKVTITASSRLARLGMVAGLRSLLEEAVSASSPAAYYPLGEPKDSTQANDLSGNGVGPLSVVGDPSLPLVFGNATGPGTDGLTAVEFTGGQYLAGSSLITPTAGFTLEAFTSVPATPPSGIYLIAYLPEIDLALFVTSTGKLGTTVKTSGTTRSTVTSAADLVGGETHHAAAKWDGSTLTLYLDGALAGTSGAGSASLVASTLSVGGGAIDVSLPVVGDNPVPSPLVGVVAQVAVYSDLLSDSVVADHAEAGLAGYAGETTDERFERYAELGGIDLAEVSAATGSTTMTHIDTTGQQVVELLRKVEATEGGVMFDARDGTLTLQSRSHRYAAASAFTLNMLEHEVEVGYAPRMDRVGLLNDVTGSNVGGSITHRARDTASEDEYGHATGTVETASEDPNEPANAAAWLVHTYAEPRERVPSLTVDALAQVGKTPNCAAVMAATVGDKITVSNRPTQAATSSVDYFIEGWTEVYGPESLKITWNLSPSAPYDQTLIFGDATRGALGVNPMPW